MRVGICLVLVLAFELACSRAPAARRDQQGVQAGSAAARAPFAPVSRNAAEKAPAPPSGFVEATVAGAPTVGAGHAVMLVHEPSRRAVPIFVGGTEGLSIELRLEGRPRGRPLTHDLFDSVLRELSARVVSARVVKLEGGVYFGVLVVSNGGRTLELDSRASDAVAMALGSGAPVFLAKDVLDRAGVSLDAIADGGVPRPEPGRNEIAL